MKLDGVVSPTADQLKILGLTNYGHFTSMLVENGQVRGLGLHLERLSRDSRALFDVDLDTEWLRSCVRAQLAESPPRTVARVTVFDPALDLGTIGRDARPHILVTSRAAADPSDQLPPLRLQAAAFQRELPAVKHIGLFGSMYRRRTAQRDGFDDVLFLNPDGSISELATSNIGFVRDGSVIWPRSQMLRGVTMALLWQALVEPIVSESLTLNDLSGMDAAFSTNAAIGVRPVGAIDSVTWTSSAHPILEELGKLYAEIPAERV